jgi:hypothetical protein
MVDVLGVHVPELGDIPLAEVCHSFVYRYLIAKGNITGKLRHDPLSNLMTVDAEFLYGTGGEPARRRGRMRPTPGSIVVFRDVGNRLQHSMIAIDAETWIGANNTGCFGVPQGRTTLRNVGSIMYSLAPRQNGWTGNDNSFNLGSVGVLTVCYIDPPIVHYL